MIWHIMDNYPNEVLSVLITLLILCLVFQFTIVDKSTYNVRNRLSDWLKKIFKTWIK